MAQIRGNWFASLRASLERHNVLSGLEEGLPQITRHLLAHAEPTAWYDEGHAVAIYEAVLAAHDAQVCRDVGRDAARFAMVSGWREMMQAIEGLLGNTPRMAFEQLPLIWNSTRKQAGELVCVESSAHQAITELHGFPYAGSSAWIAVWVGHHEALLRHFRFAGHAQAVEGEQGTVRVRTQWGSALKGASTLPGRKDAE